MSDLYLYQATDRKNLESILSQGLLINPPEHAYASFGEESLTGKIFLALSADAAEAYAECSDTSPEDIVILKVKLSCLKEYDFEYDWNNRCEYYSDINSCVYLSDIPGNCLEVCSSETEPDQNIHSFKGTGLYEIIMDTFDYECETNLENQEDDE